MRYRIRAFLSKPANLLLVFFLAALVVLSLAPMVTMLTNMFTVHQGNEKKLTRMATGTWTVWHFQKLFAGDDWSRINFWQPFFNSLIVAVGSGVGAGAASFLPVFRARITTTQTSMVRNTPMQI